MKIVIAHRFIFSTIYLYMIFRTPLLLFAWHLVNHTIWSALSLQTLEGKSKGLSNAGTWPSPRFEGFNGRHSGQKAILANLLMKECQGSDESRNRLPPHCMFNLSELLSPPRHDRFTRWEFLVQACCMNFPDCLSGKYILYPQFWNTEALKRETLWSYLPHRC